MDATDFFISVACLCGLPFITPSTCAIAPIAIAIAIGFDLLVVASLVDPVTVTVAVDAPAPAPTPAPIPVPEVLVLSASLIDRSYALNKVSVTACCLYAIKACKGSSSSHLRSSLLSARDSLLGPSELSGKCFSHRIPTAHTDDRS